MGFGVWMVTFYDVLVRFALLFYSYRLRLRLDSRFCFVGWRVLQLYLYRTFSVSPQFADSYRFTPHGLVPVRVVRAGAFVSNFLINYTGWERTPCGAPVARKT